MADEVNGELTAEETSYFENKGGEEPSKPAPDPEPKPAAKAETKAAPEAKAEEPESDDAEEPAAKVSVVPQQALHEERERRKRYQKEAEEAKVNFARLQSRLDTLQELAKASTPRQDAAPELPDINADPVGHFKAKTELLEREISENKRRWDQQEQQATAVNNVTRISQLAQSKEAEFRAATPDYDAATAHLQKVRNAQLEAYGIEDAAERQNIMAQDAMTIAASALAQGKNPAEVVYKIALSSGFQAPAPSEKKADGLPSETEKVAMIANGKKAGGSLNQMSGVATPQTTLESLLKLDDDEFAAATKGGKWQKLFGS